MILPEPQELLRNLVGIESVFPKEQKISSELESILRDLGFKVERVLSDGTRPSLVATFGRSEKYLGFYGHIDTVPPAKDYVQNPFQMEVREGIAHGLGVCDMKGGVTCILHLAAWAASEKLPVKIIFGVDEENISQGACDLIKSGLLKDLGFLIVAESGQITDFEQPISVCLGRKGRIVFEILIHGRAAHAAEKQKGINAIEKAAELVSLLSQMKFPVHSNLGETSLVVQGIEGQSDAFSVPDSCKITCSLLTAPGTTSDWFIDQVQSLAKKCNVNVTIQQKKRATPYAEAFEINTQDSFYKLLETKVFRPLGAKPMYTPSVADENFFSFGLKIPVLTIGAIGAGDHTKDEWVRLSTLDTVIDTYRKALSLYLTL